jgi:hypothetical protein
MFRVRMLLLLSLMVLSTCGGKPSGQASASPPLLFTPSASVPDYLMTLGPAPGAHYTLAEYEDLAASFGWGATVPGICFSVTPVLLLEPGDFPTAEEWLSRMYIIVDGKRITEYHSLLKTDTLGLGHRDPKTGEYLYQAPAGSPFRVCYAAALGIGTHTVTVVISKTSGEVASHSWSFYIVEQ